MQFEFLPLARYVKDGKLIAVPGFQVWIDLSRPDSRGQVTLSSPDPIAPPRIVFNHLGEEQDRLDLINSMKLGREMFAQPSWDCVRGEEIQPGTAIKSDTEILAWAKTALGTSYHPSGTCRMSATSEDGVVNERCQVHGLRNLRVVGAAVMPRIVTANLSATTFMISEKISDDIRG